MKKILFVAAILFSSFSMGQAFQGKGDNKLQVGADFQDNATGLMLSYDRGLGQNISIGVVGIYALGLDDQVDADFDERFTARLRFNAHLGNVINISPNFDVYPGLSLGTKNFGGHVGLRFFFTDGLGIFTEAAFPLSRYKTEDNITAAEELNNQFAFTAGLTFNLF